MKTLLPVFLIISCVFITCKKDEVDNTTPSPTQITVGLIDATHHTISDTVSHTFTYSQASVITLTDNDTLRISPGTITSPNGYQKSIRVITGSNVQYIALSDTTSPMRLAAGAAIDNNANWKKTSDTGNENIYYDTQVAQNPQIIAGEWANGQPGFLAFRVYRDNRYFYGWVELQVNGTTDYKILSWAYYHN